MKPLTSVPLLLALAFQAGCHSTMGPAPIRPEDAQQATAMRHALWVEVTTRAGGTYVLEQLVVEESHLRGLRTDEVPFRTMLIPLDSIAEVRIVKRRTAQAISFVVLFLAAVAAVFLVDPNFLEVG